MHIVSLAPLTVLPCSPLEQIAAAVAAGFDAVSLRLLPVMSTDIDVMADHDLQRGIERRLSSSGLEVLDVEVARLTPQLDVAAVAPAIEFAGRLGARWFAVTSDAADAYRVEDEPAVIRRLGDLCDEAARHGMGVMLEFMIYRGIGTLEHAERVVRAVDRPNIGICVDALHFFRSGATAEELRRVDPHLLACVQLCDAPGEPPSDLPTEARYGRLYPGEGDLPLGELLSAVPPDVPVSVEVPSRSRQHLSPLERAREGARSARRLLASADDQPEMRAGS